MRVKICGITQAGQAIAISQLGITTLGFICVPASERYISPTNLGNLLPQLPTNLSTVGVFANENLDTISQIVGSTGLTAVQLHGDESPQFCHLIRQALPQIELIKAFRLKNTADLVKIPDYYPHIDTILLDAYHPLRLGGTGKTLDWETLTQFTPPLPWLLAGGLSPQNIAQALQQLNPDGVDLSSGVERKPGDKDLELVRQLLATFVRKW
jgi:phosphoribosylanthranilate isomerase